MAFLDAFPPDHRALFEGAATVVRLGQGQYLIRRGEPGGDVYFLRRGTLEVVDSRQATELILTTLPEGTVVGEMAFVDDSPRSADVRAQADCEVLRWAQQDLRSLLARHPELAAGFYQQVARLASHRIRFLTEGAVAGAFGTTPASAASDELRAAVPKVCDPVKTAFPLIETALRRDPDDPEARARVGAVLDGLERAVTELFAAHPDPAAGRLAAELLARELHPYLVRSVLAERAIRRPPGGVAGADVVAHVLVNQAGGDGRLGELIDRWLLDRPTFDAFRRTKQSVVDLLPKQLPSHRNRRALLLNAGTGSIVSGLVAALSHPPTVLTVMDGSRDALALVDVGLVDRAQGCEIATIQENLVAFATGRGRMDLPKQDGIVVHGVLEYLPERIAVALLETCRALLTEDGIVVLATLGPSPDRCLLDRVLHWPTIRREASTWNGLLHAAGLQLAFKVVLPEPGVVLVARKR
jgi:extracellular factor (EF) 3-hydroxypalmitic acid methyl ester biosynthesis protein